MRKNLPHQRAHLPGRQRRPAPGAPPLPAEQDDEEEEVTGGGGGGGAGSSLSSAVNGHGQSPHQQRRLWVKDRSHAWWEQCSSADYPEADFRSAFRMGRATLAMLCDALGATVAKEDTALRAAIPVRQRVAVCVWRLATGEPLRLVVLFNGWLLSEAAAPGCRAMEMEENTTGMASDGELTATALGDGTRFQLL